MRVGEQALDNGSEGAGPASAAAVKFAVGSAGSARGVDRILSRIYVVAISEVYKGVVLTITRVSDGEVDEFQGLKPSPTVRRVIVAASCGTFIEYFDLVVYGAMASVIAGVFFPSGDETSRLLSTFAVFALAFVARPLGGLIWGPLGDRIGRSKTLVIIILLMSLSTTGVGLLPGYVVLGIWAPIALVVLRFIQGISAGGEVAGAAILIGEYTNTRHRAFHTGFLQSAVALGQLAALSFGALLAGAMPESSLQSWGWRIPFFLALPMGAVGLYIRRRLQDTPVFHQIREAGKQGRSPLRAIIGSASGWRMVGRAVLFCLPVQVIAYMLTTFMPSYLTGKLGMSSSASFLAIAASILVVLVCQPLGSLASDRFGRRPLLFAAGVAEVVLAYPAFLLLQQGHSVLPILGLMLLAAPYGMALGNQIAACLESFPAHVRYTGYAVALGLTAAFIAGPSPYISEWLIVQTGSFYAPAWLVIIFGIVSAIGAFFARESFKQSLNE